MHRALWVLWFSAVASGQQFLLSTVAGGAPPVTPAVAVDASIGDPPRVSVDAAGNIYFGSLHCIFKVDRAGTLTRVAGNGRDGNTGDGGPAMAAQLSYPTGIAVDPSGVIYFADRGSNSVRRIDASGTITTVARGFRSPAGLALDQAGNLYIADSGNHVVRRVAADGTRSTVAGTGIAGFGGDGGSAAGAMLNGPEGVAFDPAGNLYIADTFNHRVRMVAPGGTISTLAGTGLPGSAGDDGPAAASNLLLPTDVTLDTAGAVYIADLGNSRIRKVSGGVITTVAGAGADGGPMPADGFAATGVQLNGPTGLAVDSAGAIYIAEGSVGSGSGLDRGDYKIWKVASGVITTAAGNGLRNFSGDGGPAAAAQFDTPAGLAFDSKGYLYVSDSANNRVRRIAPDGTVTTVAGNTLPGFSGDGGPATGAELNSPAGLAFDDAGNLYIADTGNNRVREVLADGTIGTYAGNGNAAFFGDGGTATLAGLHAPRGVAVGPDGAVYIADTGDHRVRRVFSGIIDTAADGLNAPTDIKVDANGVLWVADNGDGVVRALQHFFANTVPLAGVRGLALNPAGGVYAVLDGNRVVRIAPDGTVAPFAGIGLCCYAGDSGPAGAARLNGPAALAVDAAGDVYIADAGSDAIREATPLPLTSFVGAVSNGASNLAGPLAPGEIVDIYGAGLGPSTLAWGAIDGAGFVTKQVAGTTVLFNGISAPVLYAAAGQVSAIVPYGLTGPDVQVQVQAAGQSTPAFTLPLTPAAPGLFTAAGTQALATNADGSANGPSNPAAAGTMLTLAATGEGLTSPAGIDGAVAGAAPPQPQLPVSVTIGGRPATVFYAGGVDGSVAGVMIVTVQVPTAITPGIAPVMLTVGDVSSQSGVTVAVK